MSGQRCTSDDLHAAIEWLGAYEGDGEMRESLVRAADFLGREMASRYAATLERRCKADIRAGGKMLTREGRARLKDLCREKGDAYADDLLRETGNAMVGALRQ